MIKKPKNIKKYIKSGGVFCPFCNSDNISADLPIITDDVENGVIKQEVNCWDCGETWEDIWRMVDIKRTTDKTWHYPQNDIGYKQHRNGNGNKNVNTIHPDIMKYMWGFPVVKCYKAKDKKRIRKSQRIARRIMRCHSK